MGAIHFSLDERLLTFVREQLPLAQFVETGTFQGDTLDMARRHFPRCESVELSQHYFEQARQRFAGPDGVELFCGPSPEFLRQHRQQHQVTPTLFWLDAHWCVADETGGEDSQSPILDELAAIELLHPDSVLLIDDARLYLCAPPKPHRLGDWPDWHDLSRALARLSDTHRVTVYNDVIACYPARIRPALDRHMQEHGADWLKLARDARRHREGKARWSWLRLRRKGA